MTSCILLLSHWSTLALSSGLKHKTVSRQDVYVSETVSFTEGDDETSKLH